MSASLCSSPLRIPSQHYVPLSFLLSLLIPAFFISTSSPSHCRLSGTDKPINNHLSAVYQQLNHCLSTKIPTYYHDPLSPSNLHSFHTDFSQLLIFHPNTTLRYRDYVNHIAHCHSTCNPQAQCLPTTLNSCLKPKRHLPLPKKLRSAKPGHPKDMGCLPPVTSLLTAPLNQRPHEGNLGKDPSPNMLRTFSLFHTWSSSLFLAL